MGDVMMLILGLIVGFSCAAYGAAKVVEDALHTGYQDGYRDGVKEEKDRQEILMKENVLFAKDAEKVQE